MGVEEAMSHWDVTLELHPSYIPATSLELFTGIVLNAFSGAWKTNLQAGPVIGLEKRG